MRATAKRRRHGAPDGDRDRHVEREKRLAALGLATDDADRFVAPQLLDEPSAFGWPRGQVGRAGDGSSARASAVIATTTSSAAPAPAALEPLGRCSALVISR